MDLSTYIEYRDELAYLMRDRFGTSKDRPAHHEVALSMASTLARILTTDDYAAILRAALRSEQESKASHRSRPAGWAFSEFFSLTLQDELGDLDSADGRREAWHVIRALHNILPRDQFTPFLNCAHDVLRATVEVKEPAVLST
ncbi:hypothetical protein [Streptomyces ramulosus]|uniref:hypothetical protein n=1 Tax=Streptomyces TaxID=1883 RepID=UPI0031F09BA9